MSGSIEIPMEDEPGGPGFAADPPPDSATAGLVGDSRGMRQVKQLIGQVANFDTSVLILGESGTGKELVAQAVHAVSERARRPFVPVNCGAIPGELLESELFGHEKGAFTGALTRRRGRFELAEGGTLFLDEIGDMPVGMQVKLLRVLQERSFERVGSSETLRCNVRVIAATHRDIERRIDDGVFREDLYYRLNVFPIQIPPLAERIDDLPVLVDHFCADMARRGVGQVRFSAGALAALAGYPWPGNVRELANLVERMTIVSNGREVKVDDLPGRYRPDRERIPEPEEDLAELTGREAPVIPFEERSLPGLPAEGVDLKAYLANIESSLIRQALERTDHTVAHAAEMLGLRRTTLVEKIRKYGLD
ncbi:sigma 54-interacting transcriptional regulator [Wenzhouxiangella limi]|uniref:Sigma-54-dependent Fis family transcriptional regulator n=1 Tax=Wenzhouxiangella limi TaxID=2707351 RepID=A0A845V337_9GAMM|nr:sigma-54-dependent Fis family transcriptional regulator [Wenzhouxiangella limi]